MGLIVYIVCKNTIILVYMMLFSSPVCLYLLFVVLVIGEFLLNAYWYMTDVYEVQQYMQFTSEQEEVCCVVHTSSTCGWSM
jgi:hypothetical protein